MVQSLCCPRFMEVNDYLPTHVRVLSDANGGFNPEILKDVLHLELEGLDRARVSELLNANKTEELYRYLLLTQCNALNAALPEMFEKLGSYTEMLLPNNILKQDGVLGRLVSDIPEEDFRDAVQIIGWMYQYYNTEPKQAVFDGLKKNIKITKEKIPAVTQLFTPDWIVRYMVENSLGRLWLEAHPNAALKANWKYYLDESEQTPEVMERLRILRSQSPVRSPEDIRLIDPCMGSGHILVYAFDVLMQIYESVGVSSRDATKLILEKNIYGLDIDRRAYQLAYFSLMMKARQYNRRILTEGIKPQVYHPMGWSDGEEYGSLVKVEVLPPKPEIKSGQLSLEDTSYELQLRIWNFKRLLAQKYDVVVTNPPYMSSSGMGTKLSEFVKNYYPDNKSDLFAVFIEMCGELLRSNGFQSMITMESWMFLPSFEKLRIRIFSTKTIVNLVHMPYLGKGGTSLGINFGTSAFTFRRAFIKGFTAQYDYIRYFETNDKGVPLEFPMKNERYRMAIVEDFTKIPGSPVAYWVSKAIYKMYSTGYTLDKVAKPKVGMQTSNNDKYLRMWFEIDYSEFKGTSHGKKWIKYLKGGAFRKWYGNLEYLLFYNNTPAFIKQQPNASVLDEAFLTTPKCTWTDLTSKSNSFRYAPDDTFYDISGHCFLPNRENQFWLLGYANSKVFTKLLEIFNSTFHCQVGDVARVAVPQLSQQHKELISELVKNNITISQKDWDSFETSWDFKLHSLIKGELTVSAAFDKWEREAAERFNTLKAKEEELNRIFIDTYGLQEELTPEVEDKDVTVRRADLGREIRSFISYAVGCMFGRYSLDSEGLAYAGGEWEAGKYSKFIPDRDNILPICDDEYFDDDITGRFFEFVKAVYGAETLAENLRYIADALGGKGTPREVIRSYFLNDFYADHCKIYQKRPIYWLFDSGKKNGFKALIYMHRYSRDLLAKLRTDYVHEQQERYRTQLSHITSALNAATGAERAKLLKQQDKLSEQHKEITAYEEQIHHLADQNIEIDLDDGVKKNYELFANVLAKI